MTESQFTAKLLKRLRAHPAMNGVPERVVKHQNTFTKGIADFSVTFGSKTTWWEVKKWGEKPTKIQQYFLDHVYGVMAGAVITMNLEGNGGIISYFFRKGLLTIDGLVQEIVNRSLPF